MKQLSFDTKELAEPSSTERTVRCLLVNKSVLLIYSWESFADVIISPANNPLALDM
jgi:hypothetical protein